MARPSANPRPTSVGVGSVDKVDAEVDRPLEHAVGLALVVRRADDALATEAHRAEAESVDRQLAADVEGVGRRHTRWTTAGAKGVRGAGELAGIRWLQMVTHWIVNLEPVHSGGELEQVAVVCPQSGGTTSSHDCKHRCVPATDTSRRVLREYVTRKSRWMPRPQGATEGSE